MFLVGKVSAGVQIYKCTAAGWTFDRLEVTLVGDIGKEIIKHFAGPTWQAKDGSTAKAAVQEPRVTVDPTAIPWLLLKTTSAAAGPGGDRLAVPPTSSGSTPGGVAPTSGYDASTVGKDARVDYTADYYF